MTGDNSTGANAAQSQASDHHNIDESLRAILRDVLGLDAADVAEFEHETGLFGHLPELDSMAVAGLLTEMEDRLDITIEDEDVDAEMLESYGGLLDLAVSKASSV